MDGDTLYPIGELARRTGLTVKTIRFYSDRGIVAPTHRSPAGYRLYDLDAVARLDLVRTLRELGLDLPTIRKVVDRELSLPDVAGAHADALAMQIRVLRLRRAVLTAVAERGSTLEETELMHQLAQLSEDERRRLIGDFLDAVFGDPDATPAFAGIMRSMTPSCPKTLRRNRSRRGWSWRNCPWTRISARVCGGWPRTLRPSRLRAPLWACSATLPQPSVTGPARL